MSQVINKFMRKVLDDSSLLLFLIDEITYEPLNPQKAR